MNKNAYRSAKSSSTSRRLSVKRGVHPDRHLDDGRWKTVTTDSHRGLLLRDNRNGKGLFASLDAAAAHLGTVPSDRSGRISSVTLHRMNLGVLDASQAREAGFGPKLIVISIGTTTHSFQYRRRWDEPGKIATKD
jgi:hypothetical protein